MNSKATFILAATICFFSVLHCSGADVTTKQDLAGKIFLGQYLMNMGMKLDCYFTLEKDQRGGKPSLLSMAYVENDQKIDTLDALVTKLRAELPGIIVVKSQDDPMIIHLMDGALEHLKDYAIENHVDVKHSGSPSALVELLSKSLEGRVGSRRHSLSSELFDDFITQVSFTEKGQTVRNVLTDYIPLSRYSHILWNAETLQFHGKQESWVQYYGPAKLGFVKWMEPDLVLPFSQGEIAYAKNSKSAAIVDSAINFITTQMQKGEPLQVRWAMFYLGKYKVEKGIPILLKYLDYQYTTVPLLDEAYPALHALVDMGQPAATATLGSLSTETNALRLELLCRVIIGVSGQAAGQHSVEAALNEIKDVTQQARVKAALTKVVTEPVPTAQVPLATNPKSNAAL